MNIKTLRTAKISFPSCNFLRGTHAVRSFSSPSSVEEALELVSSSPSMLVKIACFDIDGVPRGKYMNKDKVKSALKNGSAFCSVVFGWDCQDVLYDNTKEVGWSMGYADFATAIDWKTFRKIPWENDTPFFIMDFFDVNKQKALEICPRNLLKGVLNKCEGMGYNPIVGCEYEFFNFRESPQSLAAKNYTSPTPLTPGMFGYSLLRAGQNKEYFRDIAEKLTQFQVPIEGIHTETGPGVYEAAICYSSALEAADRAVLFKMGVKDIAKNYGIIPTFMAKPSAKLPGCGGHMHVNLTNMQGNNMFFDPQSPDHMSKLCGHFLAGQMYCLPHIMPMFAPNINSYKRFVEGFWAPTTPTWGIENRTVAFRVIPSGKSTRIEVRISGADMNPYLAIAASVASGLYGIEHKLPLPSKVGGSAYGQIQTKELSELPKNLHEAALRMGSSALAQELFGSKFVDHFVATRLWEWRQCQQAVTDWEIQRYFEVI